MSTYSGCAFLFCISVNKKGIKKSDVFPIKIDVVNISVITFPQKILALFDYGKESVKG